MRGILGRLALVPALLAGATVCAASGQGASESAAGQKLVQAVRVENGSIRIDGDLDEPQWNSAQPISDFVQQNPRTGEPATERTEVRLLYDDDYLYIGVYCFDSTGEKGVVVTSMSRDFSPFDTDHFLIILDTFDDDRNGIFFNTNPYGAKKDEETGDNGGFANRDWDGIWDVKTRVTESGWQLEEAIPFKTLRFPNKREQRWGVNFQRNIRRKNEMVQWSPVPRPYFIGRISEAGVLEGISEVKPGRNLYVKPYLTAPIVRREGDDVDFLPDAGFDVKYGLGTGFTLDLTANTDFSQVEADNQQINLTRFRLFFPEKRDFFLENANAFQVGPFSGRGATGRELIPFFSRRVGIAGSRLVPILGGARLTGRVGDYTLGLLSIQVDRTDRTPSTNFSVFRARRNIFGRSDFGGIFINKDENGGIFNRTFGADANFNFYNALDINSFLLKTSTSGVTGKEAAGYLSVGWNDPFKTIKAGHLSIQENFDPQVGFVPRAGIRKTTGEVSLRPRPRNRIPSVREFEPLLSAEYITDQDNQLETRAFEGRFTSTFQNSSVVRLGYRTTFERLTEPFQIRRDQEIPAGDYSFNEFSLSVSSDRSRMLSGSLQVGTGSFWDGDKDSYQVNGRFQPGPRLTADLTWSHDEVRLPSGDFDTNLVTLRLDYAFNPATFLNTLIQYNSTTREVNSNVRFRFIHRPLSDFFLVYNERRSSTGDVLERALIAKLTNIFAF